MRRAALSVAFFVQAALAASAAHAQLLNRAPAAPPPEPGFRVGNIKVEGLQRISEGTVYNYLPVNIGDQLTPQRVREAIRALYNTGFFRDVQLRQDGDTLVVVVLERPSIESFEITGNKEIKTEDLQKSLRNVGLATGKTFDRSVLDLVEQYLTEQYFSRGRYGMQVKETVEDQPGNRVRLFPRDPAGRPREAALVLHGPRLRQLQRRVDPGCDLARQGRHLHHHERE